MNSRPDDALAQLTAAGVSVWLDDISRERLTTGNLEMLMRDLHVRGVTSNPTIFAKAISSGSAYQGQLADLAVRGVSVDEAARSITTYDIRWACDVLRPVYDQTEGLDGRVSIEVDPRIARDTAKTIAEARALWWLVDRPNLFIKIPATVQGLPAITQCLSEGISVNVTLIFSLQRYEEVIDAFMAGLENASGDVTRLASVASFFVSRVDTEVDDRLDKLGTPEAAALRGTAALANARLAYELFEKKFATPRWSALSARGARVAAPALGFDQRQGPVLRRHHVRGRAGRAGHREHHAGGDDARDPGPRHDPRRHDPRHVRRVQEGDPATGGPRHRLRRRGDRAGERGRAEVRGIVERAARDDQGRDGRRAEELTSWGGGAA